MDDLVVVPTAMVAGGAALAREESGRVVFVDGALPGEEVVVRLGQAKRDFARARVVEVRSPAIERVAPPCSARGRGCGGCAWQHIRPEAQVRFKIDIVLDALRRIARLDEPPVPTLRAAAGPALRTTVRLGVSGSGRAGHNRPAPMARTRRRPSVHQRSTDVVETDSCLASHPLVEELIVSGRYPGAGEVLLRAGVASGERLVAVRAGANEVTVPPDVAVVGPGASPTGFVHEDVGGRRFRVGVDSFFQPGPVAAEALVAAVDDAVGSALDGGGHLVDLYGGVGLFASVLGARHGVRVSAVEDHPSAVADAEVNLSDLEAQVIATEVGRWRQRPGESDPAVVVADPARPGLGQPGVATVVASGTPRLVLVSCDPASLARDAHLLQASGYRLDSLEVVDAFPHTPHVETVSRFDRG